MTTTQKETEAMILACAGFYRAITELDNVARPHHPTVDLEREAHKATGILQKALDAALKDWNEGSYDESENGPKIIECKGNGSGPYLPFRTEQCESYTIDPAGLCPSCATAKAKH